MVGSGLMGAAPARGGTGQGVPDINPLAANILSTLLTLLLVLSRLVTLFLKCKLLYLSMVSALLLVMPTQKMFS